MVAHGGQILDRAGRFVVDDRHAIVAGQQGFGQMAADESRSAGDQSSVSQESFASWDERPEGAPCRHSAQHRAPASIAGRLGLARRFRDAVAATASLSPIGRR